MRIRLLIRLRLRVQFVVQNRIVKIYKKKQMDKTVK